MVDANLKELKKLRWVADAAKIKDGYAVLTKPGAFKFTLTHNIKAGYSSYDPNYQQGSRLEKTQTLLLPQYWLYLSEHSLFEFSLAKDPDAARETQIGLVPQYQNLVGKKDWGRQFIPCYGHANGDANSANTYRAAKTWRDRANEAAIYLQSATPHYGETWYNTAFAYRLGLVGDEVREDLTPAETIN
jgi:hypothetical protein